MAAGWSITAEVSASNDPVFEAGCDSVGPLGDREPLANAMVAVETLTPQEQDRLGDRGVQSVRDPNDLGVLGAFLDHRLQS
jgi:hypothetical protein